MNVSENKALPLIQTFLRLLIGTIFIYSGFSKLVNPAAYFEVVIGLFRIVPFGLESVVAHVGPWIEFIFGSFLILGYWTKGAAPILATLSGIFQLVLAQSLIRGLEIDECGCFGGGFIHLTLYQSFIMDTIITLSLLWIAQAPNKFLTLDKLLLKNSDSTPTAEGIAT